jgi:hypothetical protein
VTASALADGLLVSDRRRRRAGGDGKHVLTLTYSQIECQRCQAPPVRGLPCPDCGARPAAHEFDAQRQRRQLIARELLDHLHEPVPAERIARTSVSDVYRSLADWTTAFLPGLEAFLRTRPTTTASFGPQSGGGTP